MQDVFIRALADNGGFPDNGNKSKLLVVGGAGIDFVRWDLSLKWVASRKFPPNLQEERSKRVIRKRLVLQKTE